MALSQEVGSGSPLLLTLHQSCQEHSTPVSKAGLLAARALYEWTSAREGLKHNVWHPTTKQMRVFDSKPFPRQQHQRLCIRRCAKDGITKFGPAHMRHAFATLSSGSGHAAKVDQRVPPATQRRSISACRRPRSTTSATPSPSMSWSAMCEPMNPVIRIFEPLRAFDRHLQRTRFFNCASDR